MIVPFHSLNKRERVEFYAEERNRKLRDRIIRDDYNVKTDMETLISNVMYFYDMSEQAEYGDYPPPFDFDELLYWLHGTGGYETFDLLTN